MKMHPASVRLPENINARLTALSERTGRSRSFYMLEAIQEHLNELEDVYIAEQRLIDLQEGRSDTLPLKEVMKKYGMED